MNSSGGRRQRQRANRRSKLQRITKHAYGIEKLRLLWNDKVLGWLEEIEQRGKDFQLIRTDHRRQVFDIVNDAERYLRTHPRLSKIVGDGALVTLRYAAARTISRTAEPSMYRLVGRYTKNTL
jgi:hypothetical protein